MEPTSPIIKSARKRRLRSEISKTNVIETNLNNNNLNKSHSDSDSGLANKVSDAASAPSMMGGDKKRKKDNTSPIESNSEPEKDKSQPGPSGVISYDQLNPQFSDISDDSPQKNPKDKETLKTLSSSCNFEDVAPKKQTKRGKGIEWKITEEYATEELYKESVFYSDLKEDFVKHRGPNKNGVSNYVCRFAKKRVSFKIYTKVFSPNLVHNRTLSPNFL